MPNQMLENIRKNLAEQSTGPKVEESKGLANNAAMWSIADGNSQTVSSTMKEQMPYDQDEYVKKLEHSVQWVEEKL